MRREFASWPGNCTAAISLDKTFARLRLRPWPNNSTFHSMFSLTFDLKVERSLASVAKRLNFSLDFSLDFSTIHISATYIS